MKSTVRRRKLRKDLFRRIITKPLKRHPDKDAYQCGSFEFSREAIYGSNKELRKIVRMLEGIRP